MTGEWVNGRVVRDGWVAEEKGHTSMSLISTKTGLGFEKTFGSERELGRAKPSITSIEYLEQETAAPERHEYYDGEVVAVAGASINHNRIVGNIMVALSHIFKNTGVYEVFTTDLRLWVPERNSFTYPDVMVVPSPLLLLPGRTDTITNPVLLIEVLSDATSHYDRGEKFVGYRTIPTLRDYLLIDQAQCMVEQFSRIEQNKWLLTEYRDKDQVIEFSFAPVSLALRDIYDRVEFPPPPERPNEETIASGGKYRESDGKP